MDKRLEDITLHLVDQSRRIDEINRRIDATNNRIDDTNQRIDSVRDELGAMIGETNKRIDRLYEVVVRREEQETLVKEVQDLKFRVDKLERQAAA